METVTRARRYQRHLVKPSLALHRAQNADSLNIENPPGEPRPQIMKSYCESDESIFKSQMFWISILIVHLDHLNLNNESNVKNFIVFESDI